MLEDNLQRVETFYETQLSSFIEQFHVLTLQVRDVDNVVTTFNAELCFTGASSFPCTS